MTIEPDDTAEYEWLPALLDILKGWVTPKRDDG